MCVGGRGQGGGGAKGPGLCIDLCGGGLLVDGLLPQVVAALVLLLHAVDEEEDEEHGKHQAHSAGDQSCKFRETAVRTGPPGDGSTRTTSRTHRHSNQ